MSAPRSREVRKSAAAVAVALLASGDLPGLSRKFLGLLAGKPPPLPPSLKPLHRTLQHAQASSERERPLILMTGASFQLDGAPLSQFELAAGLVSSGFQIEVVASSDGPLRARYADAGIAASIAPELLCSPAVPAWYEHDVTRLAGMFAARRPDLVFASTIDLFPAVDAAQIAGVPSIWNIRESEPWRDRLADRHARIAARALACFSYAQSVIFVARASQEVWRQFIPSDRAHVLYNAPHPDLLEGARRGFSDELVRHGVAPTEKLVLSIGTLCERKGQIDLAQALGRLPSSVLSDLRVAFVGRPEPAYETSLRDALTPRVAERCLFAGSVTNPLEWISAASVLVNTSRSEGFPRSFIEAAAVGTPIIASKVDGASERLSDNHSAFFYEPGDVDTLATKLTALLADPVTAKLLANAARKDLIDSWTFNDMLAAYATRVEHAISESS